MTDGRIESEAQAICLREHTLQGENAQRFRYQGGGVEVDYAGQRAWGAARCADAIREYEAKIDHCEACEGRRFVICCEGCQTVRARRSDVTFRALLQYRDLLFAIVRDLNAQGFVDPATLERARLVVSANDTSGRT